MCRAIVRPLADAAQAASAHALFKEVNIRPCGVTRTCRMHEPGSSVPVTFLSNRGAVFAGVRPRGMGAAILACIKPDIVIGDKPMADVSKAILTAT